MKRILFTIVLFVTFSSCKEQHADPVVAEREDAVRLSKLKYTYSRNGNIIRTLNFELSYDQTKMYVEKILKKHEVFADNGERTLSEEESYLFEYDANHFVSTALISPKFTSTSSPSRKYFFQYNGELIDSFRMEGYPAVFYDYDNKGNLTKTRSGNTVNDYFYSNNVLTNSEASNGSAFKFEFGNYKNPLFEMNKGVAHMLGNYFYGEGIGGLIPVYFQKKYLSSSTYISFPNLPSFHTKYEVLESKQNYPQKVEIVPTNPSPGVKVILEYEYTNL